jgi:hypothetical protein
LSSLLSFISTLLKSPSSKEESINFLKISKCEKLQNHFNECISFLISNFVHLNNKDLLSLPNSVLGIILSSNDLKY